MSSLQVDNLQTYNSNPPVIKNVNGTEVGTFCRAWVNFNGSGTVAIRASFNVSSITDNGVGDFTVNFTNALTDANYAFALSTTSMGATAAPVVVLREIAAPFITSSLIRISTGNISSVTDPTYLSVAIFR